MKVFTLTTCHNRRECTLAVLQDLHEQALPNGATLTHVIVDDGSKDGTAAAVRERFPDVEIVQGNGNLFWAGGMRHGWRGAISGKAFDYLFVYNDDVRLEKWAIAHLLEAGAAEVMPHVVVGSFLSLIGQKTTYGGRRRSSRWHPLKFAEIVEPDGTLQVADTLNMNAALISSSALTTVGFLSDYFVHSGADFEYGLKLRKAGGMVLVPPRHVGRCELNPVSTSLPEDAEQLDESLRQLFDQKREPFRQRLAYYRRHGGWLWPVLCVSPYVTIWFRRLHKILLGAEREAAVK